MRAFLTTTLLASCAAATVAQADPATDRARADEHARRGVALYEMGRYEPALASFEQAYVLFPTGSLLYNLAQTHRRLGHCPEALELYRRLLTRYPDSPNASVVARLVPELEAACAVKDRPPSGISDGADADAANDDTGAGERPAAIAAVAPRADQAPSRARVRVEIGAGVLAGSSASVAPLVLSFGGSWRPRGWPVDLGVDANLATFAWASASYRGQSTVSGAGLTIGRGQDWRTLRLRADLGLGFERFTGLERGHPLVAPGRRIDGGVTTAMAESITLTVDHRLGHGLVGLAGARVALHHGGADLDGPLTSISAVVGLGYRP